MAKPNFSISRSLSMAIWEAVLLWEDWLFAAETVAEGADGRRQSVSSTPSSQGTHLSLKGPHGSFRHSSLLDGIQSISGKEKASFSTHPPPQLLIPWPIVNFILLRLFWYFLMVTSVALVLPPFLQSWSQSLFLLLCALLCPQHLAYCLTQNGIFFKFIFSSFYTQHGAQTQWTPRSGVICSFFKF